MAPKIGTSIPIVEVVLFARDSTKLLYDAVESFQSHQRSIRQLKEELEALDSVLKSLHEFVTNSDIDFTTLKLPLLRCGKACEDFEAVIVKCTARSGGPRTSFRDWAKIKYMGEDIVGFKTMLSGYKATIAIALGDANLRTSKITSNVLKEYKDMIKDTTSDLEDHLQQIDEKLKAISSQGSKISDQDAVERERIREERVSTQKCLDICAKVSTHIDQVQPDSFKDITIPIVVDNAPIVTSFSGLVSAQLVTANVLKECKQRLAKANSQLETHLQEINNRLREHGSQLRGESPDKMFDQERIREELESVKQCLEICTKASEKAEHERINVFEDVSMADDGQQVIVATLGDLISAKRVTIGARSIQVMGQMSDETVQQLSQGRKLVLVKNEEDVQVGGSHVPQFVGRYGTGWKLGLGSMKGDDAESQ